MSDTDNALQTVKFAVGGLDSATWAAYNSLTYAIQGLHAIRESVGAYPLLTSLIGEAIREMTEAKAAVWEACVAVDDIEIALDGLHEEEEE